MRISGMIGNIRFQRYMETTAWIGSGDKRFLCSHALKRKLKPETLNHGRLAIICLFSGPAGHRVNVKLMHVDAGTLPSTAREARLSTACGLILSASMLREDISLHVGRKSARRFSASFKERYGFSPGGLRRRASSYLL